MAKSEDRGSGANKKGCSEYPKCNHVKHGYTRKRRHAQEKATGKRR